MNIHAPGKLHFHLAAQSSCDFSKPETHAQIRGARVTPRRDFAHVRDSGFVFKILTAEVIAEVKLLMRDVLPERKSGVCADYGQLLISISEGRMPKPGVPSRRHWSLRAANTVVR